MKNQVVGDDFGFREKKVGRRSGRFDPAVKSDDLLFFSPRLLALAGHQAMT